mmetsp:Transcript_17524/g.33773  ORF Transcript_17524/g.33773 Transcript_17524/m.33773 type:complete len:207 (-) Transcript_17524:37-657(-)
MDEHGCIKTAHFITVIKAIGLTVAMSGSLNAECSSATPEISARTETHRWRCCCRSLARFGELGTDRLRTRFFEPQQVEQCYEKDEGFHHYPDDGQQVEKPGCLCPPLGHSDITNTGYYCRKQQVNEGMCPWPLTCRMHKKVQDIKYNKPQDGEAYTPHRCGLIGISHLEPQDGMSGGNKSLTIRVIMSQTVLDFLSHGQPPSQCLV